MQVLRYEHGQKYDPHYDYFVDKVNIACGGHRLATILMYLTNVVKGGETVFPSAEENKSKSLLNFGDEECKQMLCVDGAVIEKPTTLEQGKEWTGRLELLVVHSS
ncbi:unnamed protein product [Dovyalis caffra]|uniref:Fe2OG dioxygenase domain-containing protein n=1 Tax=Dovyalis caffra TaxID=77055 RepID=A0AAV1QM44_9ROSI|nr:unnamed protein product [Dovyalis caffra]